MIPKRKDDGSLTNKIGEMRPISVLQGSAKLLPKYSPIDSARFFFSILISSTLRNEPF